MTDDHFFHEATSTSSTGQVAQGEAQNNRYFRVEGPSHANDRRRGPVGGRCCCGKAWASGGRCCCGKVWTLCCLSICRIHSLLPLRSSAHREVGRGRVALKRGGGGVPFLMPPAPVSALPARLRLIATRRSQRPLGEWDHHGPSDPAQFTGNTRDRGVARNRAIR